MARYKLITSESHIEGGVTYVASIFNPPTQTVTERDRQAGRLHRKAISNLDATLNLPPRPEHHLCLGWKQQPSPSGRLW